MFFRLARRMGTESPPSIEKLMSSALSEKFTPSHSKRPFSFRELMIVPSNVDGRPLTIVVANELVEINLGINLLAVGLGETGPKHVAVVDTDILS